MQKLILKQEENVLVLLCLGADSSWKWFGLESPFSVFLSPPGHGRLGGTCGHACSHLPMVSDLDLQGAWMLLRAGPYPSAWHPWLGAALEGTTLCCCAEGGGRGCESWRAAQAGGRRRRLKASLRSWPSHGSG